MGTSDRFGGPDNANPLIPTWLDDDPGGPSDEAHNDDDQQSADGDNPGNDNADADDGSSPPNYPPITPPPEPLRFKKARGDFSRYAGSGGTNRRALGRAVADYASRSSGGARGAAQRMGSSRRAGAQIVSFLSDAAQSGLQTALASRDLSHLVGASIEDTLLGITDYVCPNTGSVEDGIARAAYVDTLVQLADTDLFERDSIELDDVANVLELFATNAIMLRLVNAIGDKITVAPDNTHTVNQVEAEVRSFVQRSVSDALTETGDLVADLTADAALELVDGIYERSYELLEGYGEELANE